MHKSLCGAGLLTALVKNTFFDSPVSIKKKNKTKPNKNKTPNNKTPREFCVRLGYRLLLNLYVSPVPKQRMSLNSASGVCCSKGSK